MSSNILNVGPDNIFEVIDTYPFDGKGDAGSVFPGNFDTVVLGSSGENSQHAEFDINNFLIDPGKVIDEAIFQVTVLPNEVVGLGAPSQRPATLNVLGYIGNGQPDASDFEAGAILDFAAISTDFADQTQQTVRFDVTSFLSNRLTEGDEFAGFAIRAGSPGATVLARPSQPNDGPQLLIKTMPSVPDEDRIIYGNGNILTLVGGAGHDSLYGSDKAETFLGYGGDDKIYSNGGSDIIDSGSGMDEVWLGGASEATVILSEGKGYDFIANYQMGATTLKGFAESELTLRDSNAGVEIFKGNDKLAVVAWKTASDLAGAFVV